MRRRVLLVRRGVFRQTVISESETYKVERDKEDATDAVEVEPGASGNGQVSFLTTSSAAGGKKFCQTDFIQFVAAVFPFPTINCRQLAVALLSSGACKSCKPGRRSQFCRAPRCQSGPPEWCYCSLEA